VGQRLNTGLFWQNVGLFCYPSNAPCLYSPATSPVESRIRVIPAHEKIEYIYKALYTLNTALYIEHCIPLIEPYIPLMEPSTYPHRSPISLKLYIPSIQPLIEPCIPLMEPSTYPHRNPISLKPYTSSIQPHKSSPIYPQ